MYKKISVLLLILIGIGYSFSGHAQSETEKLEQLSFMIGDWEGEGWILGRDQAKHSFHQTELIQPKADGMALMVDGLGFEIDSTGTITDRVIHKAFGIISYNEDRDMITMITFSEMQGRMESDIIFLDDRKLRWSFQAKNGSYIRFTEDYSTEGKWNEVGEVSMNGTDWFQFFEMNLSK